jgi:hypothetical protein
MSTLQEEPQYLFYAGATFTVEWYRDASGRMKAKEYFDHLLEEEQKRFGDLAGYFANSLIGTRLPKSLYNEEDAEAKIYAFKPGDHRFFNFMTAGRKIIIVDAYRKHSQQMTQKDLRRLRTVVAAKNDYLARVREGTYYEGLA